MRIVAFEPGWPLPLISDGLFFSMSSAFTACAEPAYEPLLTLPKPVTTTSWMSSVFSCMMIRMFLPAGTDWVAIPTKLTISVFTDSGTSISN